LNQSPFAGTHLSPFENNTTLPTKALANRMIVQHFTGRFLARG